MKFQLNGALTIGTLDGANVEIAEEVGDKNIFIFGLKVEEVKDLLSKGYNPREYYEKNVRLKKVIDLISCGYFSTEFPALFQPIIDGLLNSDQYFHLADFQAYYDCQQRVSQEYKNYDNWTKKSIINVANTGKFSTDRTIKEYAEDIWNIKPCSFDIK